MQINRLLHLGALALCSITTIANPVNSFAAYPERPIRWVVPGAAGSGVDAGARMISNELSVILGQQIVIDNRPGAGGSIGIDLVAKSTPDGYTMVSGNSTNIVMNRFAHAKFPYDPDRDLRAVVQTHSQPNVLVVSLALPVNSVAELIDYANKNPGKLLYSSSGNGSSLHFAGELFKLMTGTQIGHVPYASIPVALNDLFGGRVPLMFGNMSALATQVRAGKLRALAVTSSKRSAVMPELPTIAESGLPGYQVVAWGGIMVTAATPQAVVDKLNAAANKALQTPSVKEKAAALGLDLAGGSAKDFSTLIQSEYVKWGNVAKKVGIKPE
ncbi:MAG: tripartite tricarboxylate transporter substrate binding protein [Arenimonas sp.]